MRKSAGSSGTACDLGFLFKDVSRVRDPGLPIICFSMLDGRHRIGENGEAAIWGTISVREPGLGGFWGDLGCDFGGVWVSDGLARTRGRAGGRSGGVRAVWGF